MSAADHAAVREHCASGGEYRAETTSGINITTGSEVVGLRVATRGRVKPLGRWHKEFTLYAQDDQTLADLHRILDAWIAQTDPTPRADGGTDQ